MGVLNLVFLGPPGAGKGTQAKFVSRTFNIPQISTGDILRSAVRNETAMGKKAKEYMNAGALVPDEVVIGIVKERLEDADTLHGFILDGFPRTVPQAEALDHLLSSMGRKLSAVLSFEVAREDLIDRLVGRRTCPSCGAGFHVTFDPPEKEGVCTNCGSRLMQRDDDTRETVVNRLDVYERQTAPLKEYYARAGIMIDIDASGSIDGIQKTIRDTLDGFKA
jgi:adenylate kinase